MHGGAANWVGEVVGTGSLLAVESWWLLAVQHGGELVGDVQLKWKR